MSETTPVAETTAPEKKGFFAQPIRLIILLLVLAAAAVGGSRFWSYYDSFEGTDDAQVDGDFYPITARVPGVVKAGYIDENGRAKKGDLIAELDPTDYQMAVDQAKADLRKAESAVAAERPAVPLIDVRTDSSISSAAADLSNARAELAWSERDHQAALAEIKVAEADLTKAQGDVTKYKVLVDKDEISRQQYDQAVAVANAASARVESKRAAAEASARNIEKAQARIELALSHQNEANLARPRELALQNAQISARQAEVDVARARLAQAELNLSYTKIYSPGEGIIGKASVGLGEHVNQGQMLTVEVSLDRRFWITANFKETQLKRIHPGQRATIHVDAYDRDMEATVADFAGASGARLSLLPPENATGNYVKVVQRLPVRLFIKDGEDRDRLLRPGMSVDAKVWIQ